MHTSQPAFLKAIAAAILLVNGSSCAGAATDSTASAMAGNAGQQDGGAPPAEFAVGDPCSRDGQCPAGGSGVPTCLSGSGFIGGYCAVEGCASHAHDCPGDGLESKCVMAPTNRCLELCSTDADCRSGYTCQPEPDAAGHGPVNVCRPP